MNTNPLKHSNMTTTMPWHDDEKVRVDGVLLVYELRRDEAPSDMAICFPGCRTVRAHKIDPGRIEGPRRLRYRDGRTQADIKPGQWRRVVA